MKYRGLDEKGWVRDHAIIQELCCDKGVLSVVELGKSDFAVGVDKCLLVDPTDALDVAYVERVLSTEITRMLGFDLTLSYFLLLCFFFYVPFFFSLISFIL